MVKFTILYFNLHTWLFRLFTFSFAWVKLLQVNLSYKKWKQDDVKYKIIYYGAQKCTYNLENRRTMLIEKIIQRICIIVKQMEKSTYPILLSQTGRLVTMRCCSSNHLMILITHTFFFWNHWKSGGTVGRFQNQPFFLQPSSSLFSLVWVVRFYKRWKILSNVVRQLSCCSAKLTLIKICPILKTTTSTLSVSHKQQTTMHLRTHSFSMRDVWFKF
jgi:hypothetical protein